MSLTFSLPLVPIVGTGAHLELSDETMLCAFGIRGLIGKDVLCDNVSFKLFLLTSLPMTKPFRGGFAHSARVTDHQGSRLCCPGRLL